MKSEYRIHYGKSINNSIEELKKSIAILLTDSNNETTEKEYDEKVNKISYIAKKIANRIILEMN